MRWALCIVVALAFTLITGEHAVGGLIDVNRPARMSVLESNAADLLITVTSISNAAVTIDKIEFNKNFFFEAGERDDAVTGASFVLPGDLPIVLPRKNDSFNFKVRYTTGDAVRDGDVDFGDWSSTVSIHTKEDNSNNLVAADVRVADVPWPASVVLLGIGTTMLAGFARPRPRVRTAE